jgi:hypothetical protein
LASFRGGPINQMPCSSGGKAKQLHANLNVFY